jgi:hypothetical protein
MTSHNQHPSTIYRPAAAGDFYVPFNLHLDQMKRLLLINIQRDPDTVYLGFEPQVFDDPVNGHGLIVIAWRLDGKVDVYHQPTVTLKPVNYEFVGKGLADLIERPLTDAHYEVQPRGVDVQLAFEDKLGRSIAVRVHETNEHPRQPFSLLAPFPSGSEKPSSLPLVLLYDFYFVRQKNTQVEIVIQGKHHKADTLPVSIDGTRMYFMRYSTDPFIIHWNKDFAGLLPALHPSGVGPIEDDDAIYELVQNDGHFEISSLRPRDQSHAVQFTFSPAFPDVVHLRESAQVSGTFHIDLEKSMGHIAGVYQVQRCGDQVKIEVHPVGGWQPGVRKWSVRFMFFVVKLFKQWPKTYRWTATLDLSQPDAPQLHARWTRNV